MKLPSSGNTNLVLVRAGPRSLHKQWLSRPGQTQGFDLMVLAYGPTPLALERADFGYIEAPGAKVAGYGAFIHSHRSFVERYARVAMIDDDILADSRSIARCFAIGERLDLSLWQPSLTWDSYTSYITLLRQPGFRSARYVNFVEMMCPFFRTEALVAMKDLLRIGAETGIDVIWSAALGQEPRRLAVLDAVSVKHTAPVGRLKAMNGFDPDESYQGGIDAVTELFGIEFPGCVDMGPSGRFGRLDRLASLAGLALVATAAGRTPLDKTEFWGRWRGDVRRQTFRAAQIQGDLHDIRRVAGVRAAAMPAAV